MLLNRSHLPWAAFTLLASLCSGAVYLSVFHPGALPVSVQLPPWITARDRLHHSVGNTPLGLLYGSLAYGIFIFAVLLNTRRKFPAARLGRAQTWLRAHIWLTILTLPLVFMHAAFHFGGVMTSSLMWLYLLVMGSGFYGLALQQFLPALLKAQLPLETIYEEIPYLSRQLLNSTLKMRDGLQTTDPSSTVLLDAIEHSVLPYLASRKGKGHKLAQPRFAADFYQQLRFRVPSADQAKVEQLAQWSEERRQMDLQVRYHHWLHGWLLVHVPSSFLLVIFTGWHAIVALFLY